MPYYLAPYIGVGSFLDPFRPLGSDQPEWSTIDLRPDGGATLGGGGLNACLLFLPMANPDPRLMLLAQNAADQIGAGLKTTLVARLHLLGPPVSTQWDDLVMELLLDPPPNGWTAIRATFDGWHRVYLGGLLKEFRPQSVGASFSENWNCADSTSLTCQLTWTQYVGTAWNIVSQQAKIAGNVSENQARAESDLASSNHECQETIASLSLQNTTGGGPLCRKDTTATQTFYQYDVRFTGGALSHVLRKLVSGTATNLATGSTTHADGDTLKVRADGSSITGFKNGVTDAGPVTDTSITGNTRCGLQGFGNDISSVLIVDNWSATDLAGSVVTPRSLSLLGVGS